MRRNLPVIVLCVLAVVVIVVMELTRAATPDMKPSYEHDASIALGADILYTALPDLLGGADVSLQRHSPFTVLRDTTLTGHTYFFLTLGFTPNELIANRLLRFVERGNVVFVAAELIAGSLADSLRVESFWQGMHISERTRTDSTLHLVAPGLQRDGGYTFDDLLANRSFSTVDTLRTVVLGRTADGRPNYIRVDRGEGAFFVHAVPRAFSNYNLVAADGAAYATAALSYLPAQPAIWDGAHKPQRTREGSALRYIQENRPLAFSYYTLLLGAVLFVVFRGRRRQRPIPVVRPPANQTVRFAQAIAGLWHERGDDTQLVERRARHLRDRLRLVLHEPDLELADEHAEPVASRLGLPPEDVSSLFTLIQRLHSARKIPPKDLIELDRRLSGVYEMIGY